MALKIMQFNNLEMLNIFTQNTQQLLSNLFIWLGFARFFLRNFNFRSLIWLTQKTNSRKTVKRKGRLELEGNN